jgi:hypothetical protein
MAAALTIAAVVAVAGLFWWFCDEMEKSLEGY